MRLMDYENRFNAVQNNTSLKLLFYQFHLIMCFNAVQNNTSLKLYGRTVSKDLVLMQFKITHL